MSEKVIWYRRFWTFLKDAKSELKKVTWPARNEITSTTIVVIISVFFFGFFLFFMDVIFAWLITQIKAFFR